MHFHRHSNLIGQMSHDPYLFVVGSFATDEAALGLELVPPLVPLADPGVAWDFGTEGGE